jgi:hypothetical protein
VNVKKPRLFGGVFVSGGLISGSGLILSYRSVCIRRGRMVAQAAPADASIFPAKAEMRNARN